MLGMSEVAYTPAEFNTNMNSPLVGSSPGVVSQVKLGGGNWNDEEIE